MMRYPSAAPAARRAVVTWAVLGSVLTAALALVLGLLGGALGSATPQAAVAGRGIVALTGVVLAVRLVSERAAGLGLANPALASAGVAAAAYLLDPLTWTGRAVVTQLIEAPGLTTAVGDLALWQVAASLGIVWGLRNVRQQRIAPTRTQHSLRQPPRDVDRDRGAASVEWSGALAIASVLVLAVTLAVGSQLPGVGGYVRWAVCELLTVGQGGCGRPGPLADPHLPTTPCVVSSSASTISRDLEIVIVRVEGSNSYELARLSDGRYRITELVGGGAGVETGVGGGVTLSVNDNTFGVSATADASAVLGVSSGRVWYVTDQAEANRLIGTLRGNAIQDTVTGGSGPADFLWSLGRGAVDAVTGHDSSLPTPDETYAEGGLTLNASAEATSVVLHASGSAGLSTVLGTRTTGDGHVTVYLRTELSAAVAAQTLTEQNQLDGARGSGTVQLVTAVTFDGAGNMIDVSATGAARGESAGLVSQLFGGSPSSSLANQLSGGQVYRATLPIRSPQDRAVAESFLTQVGAAQISVGTLGTVPLLTPVDQLTEGPVAVANYLEATRNRGVVTQQGFTDNTGGLGAGAEGKLGVELGGGLSYDTLSRASTSASYWDGRAWVAWTACG
jgi:hypothetical protein